eukprot:2623979-Rhodomonas_salina.2
MGVGWACHTARGTVSVESSVAVPHITAVRFLVSVRRGSLEVRAFQALVSVENGPKAANTLPVYFGETCVACPCALIRFSKSVCRRRGTAWNASPVVRPLVVRVAATHPRRCKPRPLHAEI